MPKNTAPSSSHPLEYIFHPRSIAVVGISEDLPKLWIRRLYLDSLVQSKFPGQLYLVNPRGGEMAGFPIYRTLTEVPGPVDHVVVSIPAIHTPALLEECRAKGVKVVHVFSSGYAETGEPDRIDLQNKLVEIARQGNMRIIGPNCLGIYYPKGKIGLSPDFPMDAGSIGYLCQSGGNVDFTVRHATARGLRFSKVVSYGNASDINECDLLDYFAWDPETKVIAAYIEGISDGRRFAQALKKAAAAKPVVVFKGGLHRGRSEGCRLAHRLSGRSRCRVEWASQAGGGDKGVQRRGDGGHADGLAARDASQGREHLRPGKWWRGQRHGHRRGGAGRAADGAHAGGDKGTDEGVH